MLATDKSVEIIYELYTFRDTPLELYTFNISEGVASHSFHESQHRTLKSCSFKGFGKIIVRSYYKVKGWYCHTESRKQSR